MTAPPTAERSQQAGDLLLAGGQAATRPVDGADGTVIDRKPFPWDTREIGRAIDKTPVRRGETRASGGR